MLAMARFLVKSENKAHIHHLHPNLSHMVKKLRKSVQYIQRYLTKYAEPQRNFHLLTCSLPKLVGLTTGPILTKISHDISAAVVALSNHAYTSRFPIPFLNARATKVRSLPFFTKLVAIATFLRYRKKRSRSFICTQNSFIQWKDCENRSSGSWDNCFPRIH